MISGRDIVDGGRDIVGDVNAGQMYKRTILSIVLTAEVDFIAGFLSNHSL